MKVLLVDGMSILRNTAGAAVNLTRGYSYSFLTQLTSAVKKLKPSMVIVCWEGGGYGGREKVYEQYKIDRRQTPETIRSQREELQKLLTHLGVDQAHVKGYEADDVIAKLCKDLPNEIVIYSNDKDFLQLVNSRVSVYQRPRITGAKRTLITRENFAEITGWDNPRKFFEGQLALGDAVDQVPKLMGVTPTTVHAYFHNIPIKSNLTQKLDDFYNASADMLRNRKLMDLSQPNENMILELTPGLLSFEEALNFLIEIGFASIVKRFQEWFSTYESIHADVPA